MYAVIKTGGKQDRVEEGQRLDVELLGADEGDEVDASRPSCSSTATRVLATPDQLAGRHGDGQGGRRGQGPEDQRLHLQEQDATQRRRWGHRQHYATIEITGDHAGG